MLVGRSVLRRTDFLQLVSLILQLAEPLDDVGSFIAGRSLGIPWHIDFRYPQVIKLLALQQANCSGIPELNLELGTNVL